MPLVRVEVRNEFGLGRRELYGQGVDKEDPKAVLDGIAVAGLTGILHQLGDLSEFAAEVFHGLQEQICATSSRSHKLTVRTQCLEAALPSLEKLVLTQTSHIHFSYTAGSEWHARSKSAQHHFIDNDLPRFVMDSYEECRDPPRLHLLDKFDLGGAGSCLRRYSDPTFFRRVSKTIDGSNSLEVRREKKARKMKKKRSSLKSAVFAHGASKFNQNSRFQFSSPVRSGLSSPTASVSDSTFKSDAGCGVDSSGMRKRSGYIECIINHRNEMQPEEQESSRSSSSRLMLHDDAVNSVSVDEVSPPVGGYSMQEKPQDGSASVQSSITWDEKAEIVDEDEYKHELKEAAIEAEIPTSSGLSLGKAVRERLDEAHISLIDIDSTKSFFRVNSVEDADSEPDNYEDALNTIDTESEADFECHTKLEVMQLLTDVDVKEIGVANDEMMTNNSDCCPSNIENDSSYCVPPVEVACLQSSEPAFSDIGDEGVIRQNLEGFANSNTPPRDVASQSIETLESVDCLSGLGSTPCQNSSEHLVSHQETPSKIPGVQFWTNGGLLGLQPSKPPDFAASHAPSSSSGARFIDARIRNKHLDGNPATPTKIAECIERELCEPSIADRSTTYHDEISMASLTGNAGAKLETVIRNSENYPNGDESTSTIVLVPGNLVPVAPSSNIPQNGSHCGTEENFSSIFGLGQKLLANSLSFRKKTSSNSDEGLKPTLLTKSDMLNHGSRFPEVSAQTDSLSAFKEQFQNSVAANQRPPSPPLEYMKISFRPMNGFGTSSLRLKFPYGTDRQDSSRDMFASFQLVPEASIPFQDISCNSEDGTFCRSSPYMSDDIASHPSASDSDEWESNHSSKDKEHNHHDSVQSLSLAGSVSTSQEQQARVLDRRFGSMQSENGEDTVASFSLRELSLDLPSFESMNSPIVQEHNHRAHSSIHKMRNPLLSTLPPPPFPPVDWKNSQLHSNGSEIMQVLEDDLLNRHALSEISKPVMFRHPNEAPARPRCNGPEMTKVTLESQDHPKLSPQKESNLNTTGPEPVERGDFLHQIRTKSFNLRPTVPRPSSTAAVTANFKVTAILQKANAIRQAVGSEDGDDGDSWSDNI